MLGGRIRQGRFEQSGGGLGVAAHVGDGLGGDPAHPRLVLCERHSERLAGRPAIGLPESICRQDSLMGALVDEDCVT